MNELEAVVPAFEARVGQLMKSLSKVVRADPGEANACAEYGFVVAHMVRSVPKVVSRIVFARLCKTMQFFLYKKTLEFSS
jgi:hypothetical protein